jgi:hypothetical protein
MRMGKNTGNQCPPRSERKRCANEKKQSGKVHRVTNKLVVNAVASLNRRRHARCVLFLHFLSGIESEHLRCCQHPCRRGTKSIAAIKKAMV